MKIGYSFWGFLGHGVVDTPDGGRSHRRPLIDALQALNHEVVFVQRNRDQLEAGDDFTGSYTWDTGLPTLDGLVLEWRWPIPGRNTTPCGTPGHTCDLHRQWELITAYTDAGLPTVIWDKDLQLPRGHPLRSRHNVRIAEAALQPSPGASSLLFPVGDHALDSADPVSLATAPRALPLVYVGNQYDRDEAFDAYFVPAAMSHRHVVAGKWTRTDTWPEVNFIGRVGFAQGLTLHRTAVATVLLLPPRYARVGQMTQRLFEAVLAGCLPITPAQIAHAHRFTPNDLHVRSGEQAGKLVTRAQLEAGGTWHVEMLAACLTKLDLFRLSRQVQRLHNLLKEASSGGPSASRQITTEAIGSVTRTGRAAGDDRWLGG